MTLRTGFDGLDEQQVAAVAATEPVIAVLAGPGSGKTRTLSSRTRHLLQADKDACALLLTFTNMAAAEMKSRVLKSSATESRRVSASTFHTFCADVIRSHGGLVSVPTEFEILDSEDADEISRSVAGDKGPSLRRLWGELRVGRKPISGTVAGFGARFQAAKLESAGLDFDDLLVSAADIFEGHKAVTVAYGQKYRHILVDEFQDTSVIQMAIVYALGHVAQTVSIFADDDQAIFGFAGADSANVQKFVRDWDARVFPLTRNYRSKERIVAAANGLIRADASSSGRLMIPYASGGFVGQCSFGTEKEEAQTVASEIAGRVNSGASPSTFAVIVRKGLRANMLIDELKRLHVPVTDWRGETHSPHERRMFASALATMRGRVNKRQRRRLCELMGVPLFAGEATEDFFTAFHDDELIRGLMAARDQAFEGARPSSIAETVRVALGTKDVTISNNLVSLVDAVRQFETFDPHFSLEHLFSELALGSVGRPPTEGGGVKVASLHRTKGLQWNTVYILGLEEGQLPDYRASSATDLSAERRLCFVGVSRAEAQLFLTFCRTVNGYATTASRFIVEIGFPLQ